MIIYYFFLLIIISIIPHYIFLNNYFLFKQTFYAKFIHKKLRQAFSGLLGIKF